MNNLNYNPESKIHPDQEIIMAPKRTDDLKGYKRVSPVELRAMYGMFINHDNLSMPMIQYMGMMLDIIRSMTSYKGVHLCKFPLDTWIFQEIIYERKPSIIIELGNQCGGSTMMLRDYLFNSDIKDAKGIIAVDLNRTKLSPKAKQYPDIEWIDGDCLDPEVIDRVADLISPDDRVMIIDDSLHEYDHTLDLLNKYNHLVTRGQYFIIEDTVIGEFIPLGNERHRAYQAVKKFMEGNKGFQIDRYREKWFLTLNPEGYLEKIR